MDVELPFFTPILERRGGKGCPPMTTPQSHATLRRRSASLVYPCWVSLSRGRISGGALASGIEPDHACGSLGGRIPFVLSAVATDLSYNPTRYPVGAHSVALERTISAWGPEVQDDLARIHVGVIGAGSVGSVIAEGLARMGIERITIFDFDIVEEHNRDRLLHVLAPARSASRRLVCLQRHSARVLRQLTLQSRRCSRCAK